MLVPVLERADDGEHAVDQRVGAKEQHERRHGQARPDKRENPKQNGCDAAQRNHPHVRHQLQELLAADTPSMPQLGVSTLAGVLAEELVRRSPPRLDAVVLTSSGTEAVEAALKLARHHTKRTRAIAFLGAFHGRTYGALSLSASKVTHRRGFTPLLPEAASGTIEPRHVVVPLRVMCPHAELLLGRATAVDKEARTVSVTTKEPGRR